MTGRVERRRVCGDLDREVAMVEAEFAAMTDRERGDPEWERTYRGGMLRCRHAFRRGGYEFDR